MSKSCTIYNHDERSGCIELRTRCLIMGYINLIVAIHEIVVAAMLAIGIGVVFSSDEFKEELDEEEGAVATTFAVVIPIILIIIFALFLIMIIVYLVGIHQNKRGHVKAYLVYKVIFLIIYTVIVFAFLANPPIDVSEVFSKLLKILLNVYFLLVIHSYYEKMNDGSPPYTRQI